MIYISFTSIFFCERFGGIWHTYHQTGWSKL